MGRCRSTITDVSPRTERNQPPSSSALLTVAERQTKRTSAGQRTRTSSQTPPR